MPVQLYQKLQAAFPHAELVDATRPLDEARFVKSEEELAFLQRGIQLVEQAIEVMAREARPGRAVVRSLRAGAGEHGRAGRRGADDDHVERRPPGWPLTGPMPTQRPLATGDVISAEIEGRWGGYVAQVTQQAVLGRLLSEYAEMFAIQQAALKACWDQLRPDVMLATSPH